MMEERSGDNLSTVEIFAWMKQWGLEQQVTKFLKVKFVGQLSLGLNMWIKQWIKLHGGGLNVTI